MLLVDVALLVVAALVIALLAGAVGTRMGGLFETRRRRQLGARNAAEERRRLAERCAACGEPVNAEIDLWDRGEWWHRACWREIAS